MNSIWSNTVLNQPKNRPNGFGTTWSAFGYPPPFPHFFLHFLVLGRTPFENNYYSFDNNISKYILFKRRKKLYQYYIVLLIGNNYQHMQLNLPPPWAKYELDHMVSKIQTFCQATKCFFLMILDLGKKLEREKKIKTQ